MFSSFCIFAVAVEFMEASSERCHRLLQDVQSCVQGGLWKALKDCSACDSARVSTKISRAEATEALQDPQMSKGF